MVLLPAYMSIYQNRPMTNNKRNILKRSYTFSLLIIAQLLALPIIASAQGEPETLDKIIAIVGKNRIILQSDVDIQVQQMQEQNMDITDETVCGMMEQMILQKMLVEQAERDSVVISEEEIDGTLDNRIRYYISLYGSKERLEEISGKSLYQLKQDNRKIIKEMMLAERMQGRILENVQVTPAEVLKFYQGIPKDSLPPIPASVEMAEIIIDPQVSPAMDEIAREELEKIRQEIIDGASFEVKAAIHSDDPGSRDNGGRVDGVTRKGGGWAQEFVSATFKLQNGEISPVVKTQFGYHIIQMIQRKGDEADVRHILISPEYTPQDYARSMKKLDSVREEILAGKLSFEAAVGKFSTDEMSSRTAGMLTDPQTGSTLLDISTLDPALALMIDTMKKGSISKPMQFKTQRGTVSCRIVMLKDITEPHIANMEEDYARIQAAALNKKKADKLQQWIARRAPSFYVKLDPEFANCESLKVWKQAK